MTELDKEASQGRCFNNWVVYGVASWDCIRTNTGLLCAKSLAELRLKNQMEEALHAALKSEKTVTKSETKAKGLMDLILKSEKTIEEQDIDFQTKLDAEFDQCSQLVIKEFETRAGGEATIPEALVETWQDFRNHRIDREVRRSKTQMKLKWTERLRIKHTEVSMHAAIETLVNNICAESSDKRNDAEAENHFNDLWIPEELKFTSFVDKHYSEEEIKKKVDDIYALVCSKRFTDQPNDFDDLIDPEKEDLTVDFTKMDSKFRFWRSITFTFWSLNRTKKSVKDVVTEMQTELRDAISLFSMSSSSLQNDIENAVQEINAQIKLGSQKGPAELGAWTSQLAKAAHCHLYRNIVGRVAYLSRKAREEYLEKMTNLAKESKENYMAKVTGKLKDLDLYEQITTKLSDGLLNMAIDPARLGLRANDVSEALLCHFAISSPEMVEEKCYDELFMRKNDDLLLKYITERSATTKSMWETQYRIGEGAIRNLSYGKMDKIFLGAGCDFENLKTAIEEWFRQNDGKKEAVKNLWNKLKEQFDFLGRDDHLMSLTIFSIDKVSSSVVKSLWPEAATMICRAKKAIDRYVNDLRAPIKNLTYGCTELFPFCATKCKYPANQVVSHECHRHLVTGFGGCYIIGSRCLDTSYCTGSAFHFTWYFDSNKRLDHFTSV